jgi:hypothetical protein
VGAMYSTVYYSNRFAPRVPRVGPSRPLLATPSIWGTCTAVRPEFTEGHPCDHSPATPEALESRGKSQLGRFVENAPQPGEHTRSEGASLTGAILGLHVLFHTRGGEESRR